MVNPKFLFIACDGFGLGHVSRLIGIARNLRKLKPESDILFLTNTEAGHLIWQEGFASVKVPSLEFWRSPADKVLSLENYDAVVPAVIDTVLKSYAPDVTVIDTFPIGQRGEYLPALNHPTRRVLIYREVRNFEKNPNFSRILERFEYLIFPYRQGEIELPHPSGIDNSWVGPISARSAADTLSRVDAASRLGISEIGPTCLIAMGGGGHPEHAEIEKWLMSVAAIYQDWQFALTDPPLKFSRARVALPDNVRTFRYFPAVECFPAFDIAITRTGITLDELAWSGIPAIGVIDRTKSDEDQIDYVRRKSADDRGIAVSEFDSETLGAAIEHLSDEGRRRRIAGELRRRHGGVDGAADAAKIILALAPTDD